MQYWIVGAKWGSDDQAQAFYRRGYWEMGYDDEDQPGFAALRDQMVAGDRIAIKSRNGRGADTITIKGIGIVKEVFHGRVYVDWVLTGLTRQVPCRGLLSTIHPPLQASDTWIMEAFCL